MKRLLTLLLAIAVAISVVSTVSAQEVQWRGVNTSFATNFTQNDVDYEDGEGESYVSLWWDPVAEEYRLPTAADEAVLNYNTHSLNQVFQLYQPIQIPNLHWQVFPNVPANYQRVWHRVIQTRFR